MTPLQASVLLNEAIELLQVIVDEDESLEAKTYRDLDGSLDRMKAFRDGFFAQFRTGNRHPVKVPAVPPIQDSRRLDYYTGLMTRNLNDRDS